MLCDYQLHWEIFYPHSLCSPTCSLPQQMIFFVTLMRTIAGWGMGEWDEEDNMDDDGLGETGEDSEYVKLISQLEQQRDAAKVSTDAQDMLNGIVCTSLSLGVFRVTKLR